jgi:Iron/manganese superoxide dismutases, alpha-hairpin domain
VVSMALQRSSFALATCVTKTMTRSAMSSPFVAGEKTVKLPDLPYGCAPFAAAACQLTSRLHVSSTMLGPQNSITSHRSTDRKRRSPNLDAQQVDRQAAWVHRYSALEPHINAEIMELHHSKHHQTYVNSYNKLLEQAHEAQSKSDSHALPTLAKGLNFHGGGMTRQHACAPHCASCLSPAAPRAFFTLRAWQKHFSIQLDANCC